MPKTSWTSPSLLSMGAEDLLVVGWRECIVLPEFGLDRLIAKLDSGASLSTLHAQRIERFQKKREKWLRFVTRDDSRDDGSVIPCEARCLGERTIRSSNGQVERRPFIETLVYLGGFQWPIELSLTNRDTLECTILLGRDALASRCVIDCSRQHVLTKAN